MSEQKPIQPLNLLTGMRELLTDPKKWVKNFEARNLSGQGVSAEHPAAVCFCLQGAAIRTVNPSGLFDLRLRALGIAYLLKELKGYDPSFRGQTWKFNDLDRTTHEDVLKFLDTRIEFHLKEQQRGNS